MRTKNIFKTLALAMLMPTMLLTTACSSEDDVVNSNIANLETVANKGYALPVTVNVTREGDATTRATYNESTKKLAFSAGDKLFVYGSATAAGSFAGELTWQSDGTFSGTIYTQKEWTGAADALFTAANEVTATLLPNGYAANGSNSFLSIDNKNTTEAYDDRLSVSGSNAFVASETAKATGVEQLSLERTSTYSSGFALAPLNAILNFTISGLETGAKDVSLQIHHGFDYTVTGSVTPNASGVATFAVGVPVGANIKEGSNNLTVGSSNFTLPSSTTFAAGKIYNIARNAIPGALIGQFSVSDTKKVYFSKGNLQATYDGSSWTWAFAENQWDYIGNREGNTKVSASTPFVSGYSGSSTTVDLFCWVGTSSKWTDVDQYGITTSTATNNTNGYGNNASEGLKSDWGNTISDGHTWFTLTGAEWQWMLGPSSSPTPGTNCRTSSTIGGVTNARWVTAVVHSTNGLIIYPDALTWNEATMGTAPTTSNATKDFTLNTFTDAQWSALEAAGCVFLPAAGYRHESRSVNNAGSYGNYWSSSPNTSDVAGAYDMHFDWRDNSLNPTSLNYRYRGFSVRLVRQVE